MNARIRDVMVGLTTIVAMCLLGAILLLFGWVPRFIQDGYVVRVQMSDASGLGAGAVVRFRGVSVGEVDNVYLSDDGKSVFVDLFIHMEHSLPADIYARAEGALIGGISALQLEVPRIRPSEMVSTVEGATQPDGVLPKDGSAVIDGKVESITATLSEQLDETSTQLNSQLGAFQKDFSRAVDSMVKLGDSWTGVGNNIQALTTDQEGKDNINSLFTKANARLTEIGGTLAKLDKTVSHVNQVLTDEEMNKHIKDAVKKTHSVVSRLDGMIVKAEGVVSKTDGMVTKVDNKLNSTLTEYEKVAQTGQKQIVTLATHAVSLLDSLDKATKNLNVTMTAARDGKGTVGKLIKDPALYDNLEESAKRLTLVLKQVETLLTKLQKEGLPISY